MGKKKRSGAKKEKNRYRSTPQQEETITKPSTPQLEEIVSEDGILCSIVSLLPLRDAARTCVLSRRWRHIWTYRPKFKFDSDTMLYNDLRRMLSSFGIKQHDIIEAKTIKFAQAVNSVLQQQRGRSKIDEFVVKFYLHQAHSHLLDGWVQFAVASGTKKLALDLNLCPGEKSYPDFRIKLYDFPCRILESSSVQELSLVYCSLKRSFGFDALNHLIKLNLNDVEVNESNFNKLLSSCSSLEKLSIHSCDLLTMSNDHPVNQLRYLSIKNCRHLTKVEIKAVNLREIEYVGRPVDFIFRQSSKLTIADILVTTLRTGHTWTSCLTQFSRNLVHLQHLTLYICAFTKVADIPKSSIGSIRFDHLKFLDWKWNVSAMMNYLHVASFLTVAPFLEGIKVHLSIYPTHSSGQPLSEVREMALKHPHTHLKTVELIDFDFGNCHVEIAVYLVNNAINLESLMIQTSHSRDAYKELIEDVGQEVPKHVKFVVM